MFPSEFKLSTLNGSNGFAIYGEDPLLFNTGYVSSLGDINNDKLTDIAIGWKTATVLSEKAAGIVYVIYGTKEPIETHFNLNSLDGTNGFSINGLAQRDFIGTSLTGGYDFDGDECSDFFIGSFSANAYGNDDNDGYHSCCDGLVYAIFGCQNFSAEFDLTKLDGNNGFVIYGTGISSSFFSYSIDLMKDFNKDGLADLVIGEPDYGDTNYVPKSDRTGFSYVIYGTDKKFPNGFNVSELNGKNGFTINGTSIASGAGSNVKYGGDLDNDGFSDLILAASNTNLSLVKDNGYKYTIASGGQAFILYGTDKEIPSPFNLTNFKDIGGTRINGTKPDGYLGYAITAMRDFNGDGISDFGISEPTLRSMCHARSPDNSTYVLFGKDGGFGESIDLSHFDTSNGFYINWWYSCTIGKGLGTVDINGDGLSDFVVNEDYNNILNVVYGTNKTIYSPLRLDYIEPTVGFKIIDDTRQQSYLGFQMSPLDDFNGDGIQDLLIGNYPSYKTLGNQSYVIFGQSDEDL